MDAHHGDRRARRAARLAPLGLVLILFPFLGGASYRSTNFVVEANDAGRRPAGGRARRAVPRDHRPGLARPRAGELEDALSDPRPADRGRGRRPDLVRVPPGAGHRPVDDRRGAARPDPGLRIAPRDHAHDLRRLLRRPDAAMGRRGRLAAQRGPGRAAAPRPDRRSTCSPAAASCRSPASSWSRTIPGT